MRNLHNLVKKNHVIGLSEVKFDKDRLCSACEAGKITKKHHSAKTIMTTTRPLELLHMDLFVLKIMQAWEETNMVLLLLMTSLGILGFSFWMTREKLLKSSSHSLRELKPNMNYL